MNCQEVLAKVYLFLDGEMGAHDSDELRKHLDLCAPCLGEVGIDEAVKQLVARCCGDEQASAQLRSQVLEKLRLVSVTITTVEATSE